MINGNLQRLHGMYLNSIESVHPTLITNLKHILAPHSSRTYISDEIFKSPFLSSEEKKSKFYISIKFRSHVCLDPVSTNIHFLHSIQRTSALRQTHARTQTLTVIAYAQWKYSSQSQSEAQCKTEKQSCSLITRHTIFHQRYECVKTVFLWPTYIYMFINRHMILYFEVSRDNTWCV